MNRYVTLTEDGRISASTLPRYNRDPDAVLTEFPEDFDFLRQTDWRIDGGALVYDPPPAPERAKGE